MNKRAIILCSILVALVVAVYRPWLIGKEIIGGDWPYLFPEMVKSASIVPSSWRAGYGGGLGGLSPSFFLSTYDFLSAWISVFFGITWPVIYKCFWFFSPVMILAFGTWQLTRLVFPKLPMWAHAMAAGISVTNTYVLMIAGGGQMGVFYAISIFPWVLVSFYRFLAFTEDSLIKTNQSTNLASAVFLGMAFGIQVSLDPRIAYLSALSMCVLYCFNANGKKFLFKRIRLGILAGIISILLNLYWLLPIMLLRENTFDSLGSAYTTVGALRFFSFADFSHAFSLLHPNWPENLFGKTYFLQPEFLLLPIFAYLSLLFIHIRIKQGLDDRLVYGFAALGLIGAFLSKGANEPFGLLYVWMFEHVPGFVMFRDPTKFYVLTLTSYAVLIPFTLSYMAEGMKKIWNTVICTVPIVFVVYWLILIRPSVIGGLGGTFTYREVPMQYVALKQFLSQKQGFFRTLWVPRQSRFTFTSSNEISIEAGPLLGATDAAALTSSMNRVDIQDHLATLGIRYIIIPYDPYGEIFTDDRKYNQSKRNAMEKALDTVSWLKKIQTKSISIYETTQHKDRFWTEFEKVTSWRRIADDQYEVNVVMQQPAKLMMSESYHSGWQAHVQNTTISASKEPFGIMSFALPKEGSYTVIIEFAPRRWYALGRIISLVTFCGAVIWLAVRSLYIKKYE